MFYDSSVSKIHENGHTVSLASLAVPKFFEMIFIQMLDTVNTLMLSGYSQEAVAATSVAAQIQIVMIIVLNIILSGMCIIMSIELGKKDRNSAGKVAGTAAIMIFIFSVLIGLTASILSEQLVGIMNLEGNPKMIASGFFRIKSIFLFITMLMSCFNNLLICNGYASCTFGVGMLCNILNVILCYIVLYSGIDLPVKGVNGVAVAAVVAQTVSLLLAVGLYIKKKCPFALRFSAKAFKNILRIGVPSGLGTISFNATQVITTGFMASLGVMTLNTKVYISNIINYTSKIGWAVAHSNGVLMGRYRGRREFDKMRILYRQNMIIAVTSNFLMSAIVFIFHKPLISIFTADSEVIAVAAGVMAIDIIIEIARAVNNVSEQSLNANGDVKTTFIVPLITCWLFGVLLAYILGIKCGLGIKGCWIAFAVDEVFKGITYMIRWKSGKWEKTMI